MRVTSHKILGVGLLTAVGAWLVVAAPALASVGEMEPLRPPTHGASATGSSGGATWLIVGLAVAIVVAVTVAIYSHSSSASTKPALDGRAEALPTAR
jgi:hypothetical protein